MYFKQGSAGFLRVESRLVQPVNSCRSPGFEAAGRFFLKKLKKKRRLWGKGLDILKSLRYIVL
jgi:hypothetical protein